MQLFLLRHAEAEPKAATDETRALTAKGSKQAQGIGKFCRDRGIVPGLILSSPLKRAEETARLVAGELELPKLVQISEFLRAGMTAERALSNLRESFTEILKRDKQLEMASIMLVGHEPDFSNLTGILIGARPTSVHFRKATLMGLSLQELRPGAATIEFILPVKWV
ncbi:MAG: phosphohistidine phosphatase SixA [Verrucomicrobia bacterium]|nr:phosphohistidine phosphatase SixA [Verrucomicrobiota bacterium]MBV8378402.1 phosphohistidine phosphatase SixA [Verrucomicrobiota bacterium]